MINVQLASEIVSAVDKDLGTVLVSEANVNWELELDMQCSTHILNKKWQMLTTTSCNPKWSEGHFRGYMSL